MHSFNYVAYDQRGVVQRGTCAARNKSEVFSKLQREGLIPVDVLSQSAISNANRWLPTRLNRQFSNVLREEYLTLLNPLLAAGLSIVQCHRFLSENSQNKQLAGLAGLTVNRLVEGRLLSNALEDLDFGFSASEIAVIRSAEQSGHFGPALLKLAEKYKQKRELRDKIVSAAIYPIILVATALLSVAVICAVLVPNVLPLFQGRESEMPLFLQFLKSVMDISVASWSGLVLIAGAVVLVAIRARQSPYWSSKTEKLAMKFKVIRHFEAARVSNDLAVFIQAGHTLQSALGLTERGATYNMSKQQIRHVREQTSEGEPFSHAVRHLTFFQPADHEMLGVAAASNNLQTVLMNISKFHEHQAIVQIERFVTLLTPVMTLVMGLLVGALVMTVMQSILSLNRVVL